MLARFVVVLWATLLTVVLGACSDVPGPLDLPVALHVSPELTEADAESFDWAVYRWLQALPPGVSPFTVSDNDMDAACGVFVSYASPKEYEGKTWLGYAQVKGPCTAVIRIRPGLEQDVSLIFQHELGHILIGIEHSDDEGSIMWPKYGGDRKITSDDVAKVMARIEGGAP